MIKPIVRSPFGGALVGWLLAGLIGLLMVSVRWSRHDRMELVRTLAAQQGVIAVFWHDRIFAMPYLWPRRFALHALQSPHADGRMMAHVIRCFGVGTVWGSSNRQPLSGLRGLIRVLQGDESVALTPDGPRGPARQSALGPLVLAQKTGKPVLPICWVADRCWRAGGWDRMFIPKPFARGRIITGQPVHVSGEGREALEVARHRLEVALNDLEARAQALFDADDTRRTAASRMPYL